MASFTVKINTGSLKNVEVRVREKLKATLKSQALLNDLGQTIVTDIQFQTRKSKFKPLTDAWIEMRKRISGPTDTHQAFSARRSNLTLTGQLLDSLSILTAAAGKLVIGFKGDHKPYRVIGIRKPGLLKVGKTIPNEKLAEYVASGGRPFMFIRKSLVPILRQKVVDFIRRSGIG